MPNSSNAQAMDAIEELGWVQAVEWFESIDSTNLAAKRKLAEAISLPSLFVADRQTAGRGRSDHRWWSPKGCLMLTLVIDQAHAPSSLTSRPLLALIVGLAVAETCDQWLHHDTAPPRGSQLKWPNDIYVAGKKIGGILIESLAPLPTATAAPSEAPHENHVASTGAVDALEATQTWLIGIGINVDIDWSLAPVELRQKAMCLATAIRRPVDRGAVLVHLIERLEYWVGRWQAESSQWLAAWSERCLLTGRVIRAQSGRDQVIGLCEGVDSQGRLLVRDQHTLHELSAAEILSWQ